MRRLIAILVCLALPVSVRAQTTKTGSIQGVVTTQGGTVHLAGALVTLGDGDREIARQVADGDARFRFNEVPEGRVQITASLDGFTTVTVQAVVSAGKSAEASLDLPIAGVAESVDVVAPTAIVPSTGTLSGSQSVNDKEIEQLAPSGGFQA